MSDQSARIGIAVVEREGCYLVGTRGPTTTLAGCSEFPGGKCRSDEAFAACAIRECHEETGLTVDTVRRLYACRHAYPHGVVELEFWLCHPADLDAEQAVAGKYDWVPAQSLKLLRFPEANRPVIELLASGGHSAS